MAKKRKTREHVALHPVMTFILIIFGIILLSAILSLFNFSATHNVLNSSGDYVSTTESVSNLMSLSGIKYIFSNTVSNFANFTVLSHLIIVLLGIGVMEYSGFLKTAVELLTKRAKKNSITFVIILASMLASIVDNLPFVAFIPLTALVFKYGKRNPNIGIISTFAALTCGYGLSLFFTSVDSALSNITVSSANVLLSDTTIRAMSLVLIMFVSILVLSILLTLITENFIARKVGKYDFGEDDNEEIEERLTRPQKKGLALAFLGSFIYLIIFIYNIIPGLPLSGNFLNSSETLYIDKLFGAHSFFANGFVFIITILFIIWGLLYGIGAKSIKNNREFVDALGYSLNGVGKTVVFIFVSSALIAIFKKTNIGGVIVAMMGNLVATSHFKGLALVILLFVCSMISAFFMPLTLNRWAIMSGEVVPAFLNSGLSGLFAQVIFRFGECVTLGLTPLFAYYIIYLAYLERYNQNEKKMSLLTAFKYQLPYSLCTGATLLVILVIWYIISLPLGIGGLIAL